MEKETITMEETTEIKKEYELRDLKSKDLFPMAQIIKKIGVREFKECFYSEAVQNAIRKGKEDGTTMEELMKTAGLAIIFDMTGIVLGNLGSAENEVYTFLSNLSGKSRKELEELDLATFAEMVADVFRLKGFADFIGVVSGLFK